MYSYSVPARSKEHLADWCSTLAKRHTEIRCYWHVYMLVDGKRTVLKITWLLQIPYARVNQILERMERIGLVVIASPTVPTSIEKTVSAQRTGEKQPRTQEEADRAILRNFHAAFVDIPRRWWQYPWHWLAQAACRLPVRTRYG